MFNRCVFPEEVKLLPKKTLKSAPKKTFQTAKRGLERKTKPPAKRQIKRRKLVDADPWGRPRSTDTNKYVGTGRTGSNGFKRLEGSSAVGFRRDGQFQRDSNLSSKGSEWRTSRVVVNKDPLWPPPAKDQTQWQARARPPAYPVKPMAIPPPTYLTKSKVLAPQTNLRKSNVAPPLQYPVRRTSQYPSRKEVPLRSLSYSAGSKAPSRSSREKPASSWSSAIVSRGPTPEVYPARLPPKEVPRKVSLFLKNSELKSRPLVDIPARGNSQRDWQDQRTQGFKNDSITKRLPLRNERGGSWLLGNQQGAERERNPPNARAEWVSFEVNRTGSKRTGNESSVARLPMEESQMSIRRRRPEPVLRPSRESMFVNRSQQIEPRYNGAGAYENSGRERGLSCRPGLERNPYDYNVVKRYNGLMSVELSRRER